MLYLGAYFDQRHRLYIAVTYKGKQKRIFNFDWKLSIA